MAADLCQVGRHSRQLTWTLAEALIAPARTVICSVLQQIPIPAEASSQPLRGVADVRLVLARCVETSEVQGLIRMARTLNV